MMIRTAKNAGFCFGVKRAVEEVYKAAEGAEAIYTYGPIIHNETVIRDLEERGVHVLHSEAELMALSGGTVVLRSHGVSRHVMDILEKKPQLRVIDATCPFVTRIHEIVARESAAGAEIVIIGSAGHAEVEGTIGWSSTGAHVIETEAEAEAFSCPPGARVCVVAQTTFNAKKFEEIVALLHKKRYNYFVVNTICNATNVRQQEAREIAQQSDVMIVIGSESSSNSAKLFELCKKECERTLFIQSRDDLRPEFFLCAETVGITAGASTPQKIIQEVFDYVRNGTDF